MKGKFMHTGEGQDYAHNQNTDSPTKLLNPNRKRKHIQRQTCSKFETK